MQNRIQILEYLFTGLMSNVIKLQAYYLSNSSCLGLCPAHYSRITKRMRRNEGIIVLHVTYKTLDSLRILTVVLRNNYSKKSYS